MADNQGSSSSSDDWDAAGDDLEIPLSAKTGDDDAGDDAAAAAAEAGGDGGDDDDDDEYWKVDVKEEEEEEEKEKPSPNDAAAAASGGDGDGDTGDDDGQGQGEGGGEGEPMIVVDLTALDPSVHSRFDAGSVNDPEAVSTWRRRIESEYYTKYAQGCNGHRQLVADGVVVACGSSVWRGALSRLRQQKPGHYFLPVFPPRKEEK